MSVDYYRVREWKPTGLDGGLGRWYKLSPDGLEDPNSHVVAVERHAGDRPSELVDGDDRFIVHLEIPADGNTEVIVLESTKREDK